MRSFKKTLTMALVFVMAIGLLTAGLWTSQMLMTFSTKKPLKS